VNLPKLKTHKKTGVTLALKNLVGINGDKNWLPHHCVGSTTEGGDEFPNSSLIDRTRSAATEMARKWLSRGVGTSFFRAARRLETSVRGDAFIRSGNWYGNRTTWRMCVDLNRCLYYSDATGAHFDAAEPVRNVLTLLDGIVAGEGAGPLAPRDVPLGVVIASLDPVALDLVALRLMGFDAQKVPKVRETIADTGLRVTRVRSPEDVVVSETDATTARIADQRLADIRSERTFEPHAGWLGHLESEEA
jgi:hypothetical protein